MNVERESVPNKTPDSREVDFRNKRLDFWLRTVPDDLWRYEYELWKRYRALFYIKKHEYDTTQRYGRFTYRPAYTDEMRSRDWREFENSFLLGDERKERLENIIEQTTKDLPTLLDAASAHVRDSSFRLVALFGSSVYGPRRPGEVLSDVDVHFLLNNEGTEYNFEITPRYTTESQEIPYHLVGTGQSDESRGKRLIHWLLYPHIPLWNTISSEELNEIIQRIVQQTQRRAQEIQSGIEHLDGVIESSSREMIHESR